MTVWVDILINAVAVAGFIGLACHGAETHRPG